MKERREIINAKTTAALMYGAQLFVGELLEIIKNFHTGMMYVYKTRPEVYSCARVSTLPLIESVITEMAKL